MVVQVKTTNKCTLTGNQCGSDEWNLNEEKLHRPQCICQWMYLAGYEHRKLEESPEQFLGYINGLGD